MSNANAQWVAQLSEMMDSNEEFLSLMDAMLQKKRQKHMNDSTSQVLIENNSQKTTPSSSRVITNATFDSTKGGYLGVFTPTYNEVFSAPKKSLRDGERPYGKKLLEAYFKEQHGVHLANYRRVRRWFHDYIRPNDLRHNKEEQEKIRHVIEENHHEIQPLKFSGAEYIWKQDDIYHWWISSSADSKKYEKRKESRRSNNVIKSYVETASNLEEKLQVHGVENLKGSHVMEDEYNHVFSQDKNVEESHVMEVECNHSSSQDIYTKHISYENFKESAIDGEDDFDVSEDEFYDDVLNGTQFPSFIQLLEYDTSKRVKAIRAPSIAKNVPCGDSSSFEGNKSSIRKSQRERKITYKLKNHLGKKHGKRSVVETEKTLENVMSLHGSSKNNEDTNLILNEDTNIQSLTSEEMETILLKYFNVPTIDIMYKVLKASYSKIRKEDTSFRKHSKDAKMQSLEDMRDSLVSWLLDAKKIKLNMNTSHDLSVEDVYV